MHRPCAAALRGRRSHRKKAKGEKGKDAQRCATKECHEKSPENLLSKMENKPRDLPPRHSQWAPKASILIIDLRFAFRECDETSRNGKATNVRQTQNENGWTL